MKVNTKIYFIEAFTKVFNMNLYKTVSILVPKKVQDFTIVFYNF